MPYAGGRRIVDADSHLMEWPGFLTDHADPAVRDALPPLGGGRSGLTLTDGTREPGEREALMALGDDLVRKGGHDPLGRFDRALATLDDAVSAAFYAGNAEGWLGLN